MIKYIFSLTIIFSASLCAAQIQGARHPRS